MRNWKRKFFDLFTIDYWKEKIILTYMYFFEFNDFTEERFWEIYLNQRVVYSNRMRILFDSGGIILRQWEEWPPEQQWPWFDEDMKNWIRSNPDKVRSIS